MNYLYSTRPYLAWCINRYFYRGVHYVWAAAEFYPYRLLNPRSSDPYHIYQDLYEPWKDLDQYSKMIAQFRLALWKGVVAQEKKRIITGQEARRLKRICKKIDLLFFYPVVFRIKPTVSIQSRWTVQNSGTVGSSEYLIPDLDDTKRPPEFDILFLDYTDNAEFERLLGYSVGDKASALPDLEARLVP